MHFVFIGSKQSAQYEAYVSRLNDCPRRGNLSFSFVKDTASLGDLLRSSGKPDLIITLPDAFMRLHCYMENVSALNWVDISKIPVYALADGNNTGGAGTGGLSPEVVAIDSIANALGRTTQTSKGGIVPVDPEKALQRWLEVAETVGSVSRKIDSARPSYSTFLKSALSRITATHSAQG